MLSSGVKGKNIVRGVENSSVTGNNQNALHGQKGVLGELSS